ncbi:tRNA-splicing ligase RtcB [Thermonema lapsum]|uniref:3'-phosphate/5'-hydroxy nucleic acid ligase n=1 Tax=Thermonema lapsum TaxID=28195 RepID=A0A846MMR8_9BACT|nr:RtcB family protein [Thermonema lapsum]NIK72848.1 tRNA-splicing ligase RtcB [Thermonema lapsum]
MSLDIKTLTLQLGDRNIAKQAHRVLKKLLKKGVTEALLLQELQALQEHPQQYTNHKYWGSVAALLVEAAAAQKTAQDEALEVLRNQPLPYAVFGEQYIDTESIRQMNNAMRLPIAEAGALMPDAHVGYGIPIGGVLATRQNVVIPYAVGVDIACRMCLSIWDVEGTYVEKTRDKLKKLLGEHTFFGINASNPNPLPDDIWDKSEWKATKLIRSLRKKAEEQIGTSGTGNHFVEWGILDVYEEDEALGIPKGQYLALLSHSGSRGFGASIANYYSKLAKERTRLPKELAHLAWLSLDTEEGQEYWISMHLAGEYASANHHQIHRRIAKALGLQPVKMVENHHNFAWKETLPDGRTAIVHRKGATPAHAGTLGVIPGSMIQAGFVVKGLGAAASLNSASHGAGRLMSRKAAFQQLSPGQLRQVLQEHGVELIGGDLDEAPMVYKNLTDLMKVQKNIVKPLAAFYPKIVRMAEPDRRPWARED